MRKLPPLNALRAFEAAGRHGSLTKAAQELFVTHGAVSRHVAQLESWLGVTLFHRSASQVRLTPAGRQYLAEITAALDRIAVASSHLKQEAAPTVLRVNAPPTFVMRWLIPRMSLFQRLHPGVEIRLTTSTAPIDFEGSEYDMAIRGSTAPLPTCRSIPFMTELIMPVCHTDVRERVPLNSVEQLAHHTLISYTTEPVRWDDWLQSAGAPGMRGAHTLHFEQMYFALQAATEGLGVVLVPLFLVIDDVIAGRLCLPLELHNARQRTYHANTPASQSLPAGLAAFQVWLQREGQETERSIAEWTRAQGLASAAGFGDAALL
jgi:LysR family transcriptional regulator, glycine cleavage system transcriptional activator